MAKRIAIAALGMLLATGPALAEAGPFASIQSDIQRALHRLDQRLNQRPAKKVRKIAPTAGSARQPAATVKDDSKAEVAVAKADDPAMPLPRLRPAAAPETAVGGFTATPAFSEADEAPANAAEEASVGGYFASAEPGAAMAAPDEEPLAYAAGQPPLPRVNPRIADAMANIPAATKPGAGKPIKLAALPPADDAVNPADGMSRLNALGVSAKALPPIRESACGMPDPVVIASLDDGDIPLSGVAEVNHAVAETFATWVRDTVEPAARATLGAPLTGLRILDSYSCRTRDHIKDAKLSEHAYGNAIDVGAFRIGKQWINVGGSHSGDQQAFLDKVRAEACGPFKTVLGPGSDSYHAEHFHLDLAKRRTSGPSRGLYCH